VRIHRWNIFINEGQLARLQSQWEDNKKAYYKAGTTVSVIIYRIMISNSNEEASSGEKENAVMANADTNTGSSDSELTFPLN
jgi:hypothetical protein